MRAPGGHGAPDPPFHSSLPHQAGKKGFRCYAALPAGGLLLAFAGRVFMNGVVTKTIAIERHRAAFPTLVL